MKLLEIFMETGCWGRRKIVIVECLAQCRTSVDVVALCSPSQSTTGEACFCGHEYCKEAGQVPLTLKSVVF